ncbi:carbohydrate-binding module family 13 protein [Laetiporus sulphureus 93-53]|uniref:Carbohydrate-binding module family 13 protein n=1 Tax=Laetiporus sulphureus 93-53 TaxID=1314785 RepID=A0A165C0E1_9APHY|nr:carbohydrate-binding module family 13 protein [Laetiporus sulphureus 93-53]KZT01972.1 carbohydrate-binding module family 13 protein [Laetiporus sulphureus 93-53]
MYVLLDARNGTALDLSGGDQKTLICLPAHMGPNQQWEFIPSGKGYTIRSACASSRGLYLTLEDIYDNAPIVASPFPASWNVQIDEKEETLRISWPNTEYVMDLIDWGNAEPGAKVKLMKEKPGERCQTWRYIRCRPAEEQGEKVAESTSKPIISETVIVAEGKDFITTTRTTTTTLITTVTTVARTAR